MLCKIYQLEEEGMKNYAVIFALEEKRNERYRDPMEVVRKCLKQTVRPEIVDCNTGHVVTQNFENKDIRNLFL
jgi:hypothetical protein